MRETRSSALHREWSVETSLDHSRQSRGAPPRPFDVTFREDTSASRSGNGPVNLATIRAAIIAAIKDAGYLHVPEGRRDHSTPAETLCLHGLD